MNSPEEIQEKIIIWFRNNRMGEMETTPCYWSLYPITNINQTPNKTAGKLGSNFTIDTLEESVQMLVELMSSSSAKYYAVRLRAKVGDAGFLNNFPNPYYQPTTMSSISGMGNTMGGNGNSMEMYHFINGIASERQTALEIANQERILQMEKDHKRELREQKRDLEYKREREDMRAEIDGLRNKKSDSLIREIAEELKPLIGQLGGKMIQNKYKAVEYIDEEEQQGEQGSDTQTNESNVLKMGLDGLATKVEQPESLVFKVGMVVQNLPPAELDMLLGMIESKYQELRTKKQTENG